MYELTFDDEKTIVRVGGQWAGCVAVQENGEFTPEALEAFFDAPILGVAP